jgi:hypothetical protein
VKPSAVISDIRDHTKNERKKFFSEEKNQKTFPGCFARSSTIELKFHVPVAVTRAPMDKSFLVLFFKKEPLPCPT